MRAFHHRAGVLALLVCFVEGHHLHGLRSRVIDIRQPCSLPGTVRTMVKKLVITTMIEHGGLTICSISLGLNRHRALGPFIFLCCDDANTYTVFLSWCVLCTCSCFYLIATFLTFIFLLSSTYICTNISSNICISHHIFIDFISMFSFGPTRSRDGSFKYWLQSFFCFLGVTCWGPLFECFSTSGSSRVTLFSSSGRSLLNRLLSSEYFCLITAGLTLLSSTDSSFCASLLFLLCREILLL